MRCRPFYFNYAQANDISKPVQDLWDTKLMPDGKEK